VEIFQSNLNLATVGLLGKFTAFSRRSKFPHFRILPENYLSGEMYLMVSFITPNTISNTMFAKNGQTYCKK